jgi:hypothetical protein
MVTRIITALVAGPMLAAAVAAPALAQSRVFDERIIREVIVNGRFSSDPGIAIDLPGDVDAGWPN